MLCAETPMASTFLMPLSFRYPRYPSSEPKRVRIEAVQIGAPFLETFSVFGTMGIITDSNPAAANMSVSSSQYHFAALKKAPGPLVSAFTIPKLATGFILFTPP